MARAFLLCCCVLVVSSAVVKDVASGGGTSPRGRARCETELPSSNLASRLLLCPSPNTAASGSADDDVYCPKDMVPSRPGAFKHYVARRGCCVLDVALALGEMVCCPPACRSIVRVAMTAAHPTLAIARL